MGKMVEDLEGYFGGLLPPRDALLLELEEQSRVEGIASAGPLVGGLLNILVGLAGGNAALELGAAHGYTAIHLGRGLRPGGRLVTVEQNPVLAARARSNLGRAGLAVGWSVVEGATQDVLPGLDGPFDLVFLDVAKEAYLPALAHCHRLLRPGGLLVADNTGFNAARDFVAALGGDPGWRTVNLLCFLPGHSPERDGLSLALRL